MDLTVITITWNSAKYIDDQIESVVLGCEGLAWEQIIVDNASSDDTTSIVAGKMEKSHGRLSLILNKKNLGFSAGYNLAVKRVIGKYFLYLNPDMRILDSIKPLIQYLDTHPAVGIVGAKLVGVDGQVNPLATPRRWPRLFEVVAQFFKLPHVLPKILDKYLYRDIHFDKVAQPLVVDSVRGSFMLVRRAVVDRLGFAFDPRYFLWWEDVDLCREVDRLGYKIIWHPGVRCIDSVGRSFRTRNFIWKQIVFFKNAFKYFIKWQIRA